MVGSSIGYVFLAVLLSAAILSSMIAPVMSAVATMRSARTAAAAAVAARRRGEPERSMMSEQFGDSEGACLWEWSECNFKFAAPIFRPLNVSDHIISSQGSCSAFRTVFAGCNSSGWHFM